MSRSADKTIAVAGIAAFLVVFGAILMFMGVPFMEPERTTNAPVASIQPVGTPPLSKR